MLVHPVVGSLQTHFTTLMYKYKCVHFEKPSSNHTPIMFCTGSHFNETVENDLPSLLLMPGTSDYSFEKQPRLSLNGGTDTSMVLAQLGSTSYQSTSALLAQQHQSQHHQHHHHHHLHQQQLQQQLAQPTPQFLSASQQSLLLPDAGGDYGSATQPQTPSSLIERNSVSRQSLMGKIMFYVPTTNMCCLFIKIYIGTTYT